MSGIPVMTYHDGATFKELERIAAAHDTTIAALLTEAGCRIAGTTPPRRARGRRRDHDNVVIDEWVVAYRMGVSTRVIAERYHCSNSIVQRRLAERGVISA